VDHTRKALLQEFLKRMSLDKATKESFILAEALRRTFGDSIDADEFVEELKKSYFDQVFQEFERRIKEVESEYEQKLPEKQLYYLSATVFAESLLGKPAPASLIFEVLRCARMEEERNFPNRYYFLKQLEDKGLVKKVTVVNSKAEHLYCPTEEGVSTVDGTEAFNQLVQLKEKIMGDDKVRKLVEQYSKEELEISEDLPKILATSQVISENEDRVKVLLYGREVVNLTMEEIKEIDSVAKSFGKFIQRELRKLPNLKEKKAMAYIVYAYEKGWIDIVEKGGKRGSVMFERRVDL